LTTAPAPAPYKVPYTLPDWLKMMQSNPNVFARVQVALGFLKRKFPLYNDERLLSELVCHDYSMPVSVVSLAAGTRLTGYKTQGANPLSGTYFAPDGTPLARAGVGWEGRVNGQNLPKVHHRYRVVVQIPEVLQTTCAPARDMWSDATRQWGQLAGGGATQYVIPNAASHLSVV
jgi:hypothetical protein